VVVMMMTMPRREAGGQVQTRVYGLGSVIVVLRCSCPDSAARVL
jgi:hypothetical protein